MMKTEKRLLTRSNLRDFVIFCSLASVVLFGTSTASTIVGFCLLAAGCFLHMLAKGVLVRNVILCNRGVYSLVRHPYYLANYVIDSAFCVLSGNVYLLLAYPFLFFWSYGPTLRKEENFLASKYPDSFLDDSFEIPQVFPDTASLKKWNALFEGFSIKRISMKECARAARFFSAGFALMFVNVVRAEGITNLLQMFNPTRGGHDEFFYMLFTVAFFFVSLLFLRMARYNQDMRRKSEPIRSWAISGQSPSRRGSQRA